MDLFLLLSKFINIGKTNQLGEGAYIEGVINLHSNTLNHMKIKNFSAETDEENDYFIKYVNMCTLTAQNVNQAMSNSYLIITKRFRVRITVSFFPNTLNNKDLNYMYCSLNIILLNKSRTMRWAGYIARMEEKRGLYGVLVGKPERNRPRGRPRRKWENNNNNNNNKTDLQEM